MDKELFEPSGSFISEFRKTNKIEWNSDVNQFSEHENTSFLKLIDNVVNRWMFKTLKCFVRPHEKL